MLNRLLNASGIPPGKQATERNYLAAPAPVGSFRLSAVALIFFGLGLIWGCGGPSQQVLTAQAMSQMQAQKSKQDLQQQLIFQAPQSSLSSYKDYQVGPEDLIEVTFFGSITLC